MKVQEIITTDRETGCCDDCSERILKALRDAAGASDTDSITIAADGTVGRLEDSGRSELTNIVSVPGGVGSTFDTSPLYRVVTP